MRVKQTGLGFILTLGLGLSACGGTHDFVKTDATLGRVVVYRNGVAFFERTATLEGNELRMSVPRDKVDDFLKSLTVRDAATDKSLPISFPRKDAGNSALVEMVVRLPEGASREVILTYITDSPAWKPSYRVVVNDEGKVQIEGWAIVDNTSGENWNDVLVGVGSSSALSFRYDLWSIRDVHRQTLASQDHFAVAPPQGASTYGGEAPKDGTLITDLSDGDMNMPQTHPERASELDEDADEPEAMANYAPSPVSGGVGGLSTTATRSPNMDKERSKKRQADAVLRRRERDHKQRQFEKNRRQVSSLASKLKTSKSPIVIEGYAGVDESDKDSRALDRANVLRNQLIQEGVAPAQLKVRSAGAVEGRPAGVRLIAETGAGKGESPESSSEARPVGESHFQSSVPMSVQENSSVMVSIVKDATEGEIVYLYDSESSRGNDKFAFKAVRFENPTKNTLEAGPVTVYGKSRFVGEGLTDPIPPEAMAMVPFALDRQLVVERKSNHRDRISKLVKLDRGVLTTEVQHLRETKLKIKNRLHEATTVYVRHSVQKGWNLLEAPENVERLGEAFLFPIKLAAGESKDVLIEEATPMTKTLDLRSRASMEIVQVYLSGKKADKEFAEKMQGLLALRNTMNDHQVAIESLRERMGDYRVRMDELHIQIISLKAVKSGGTLLKHLQLKMKDISDRVQKATISLVEHQEQLMLARIRFQDAVAELTLKDRMEQKQDKARQPRVGANGS